MKVGDFVRHKANHEINGIIIEIKDQVLDPDDPFAAMFEDFREREVWILASKYKAHAAGNMECLLESLVEVINESR
jgi:hypothetical protein